VILTKKQNFSCKGLTVTAKFDYAWCDDKLDQYLDYSLKPRAYLVGNGP